MARLTFPRILSAASIGIAAVVLVGLAASAQAVTFGADLAAYSANSSATCNQFYFPFGGGPWSYLPTGGSVASCTMYNGGRTTDAAGSTVVPIEVGQSGVITEVRIKTGAQGGRTVQGRLTVLEAIRPKDGSPTNCCIGVAASASITLAPNRLVTVATDLPVSARKGQEDSTVFQILALTVLDGTVTLPAYAFPANSAASAIFTGSLLAPAIATGEERFTGHLSTGNTIVLMSADLRVDAAPSPSPTPSPTPSPPSGLPRGAGALAGTALVASNGRIPLRIACGPQFSSCAGTVALQSAAPSRTRRDRAIAVYGRSRFSVPGGQTATVRVPMGTRLKALLANVARSRVVAVITTGTGSAARITAKPVTIRR